MVSAIFIIAVGLGTAFLLGLVRQDQKAFAFTLTIAALAFMSWVAYDWTVALSRGTVQPTEIITAGTRPPFAINLFIGQAEARANLSVFIESARRRGEAMDHTLFHGPPGLGKTTLAQIMARELGVSFRMTSGPVLAKAGDLAAILTNLEARDVLFIDEIHRLNPVVEEILYPAMEDFELDLVIGEGPAARTVWIELQPFTLVGATTRLGLLTTPLRDRFGIVERLGHYEPAEMAQIVCRSARILAVAIDEDGAAAGHGVA